MDIAFVCGKRDSSSFEVGRKTASNTESTGRPTYGDPIQKVKNAATFRGDSDEGSSERLSLLSETYTRQLFHLSINPLFDKEQIPFQNFMQRFCCTCTVLTFFIAGCTPHRSLPPSGPPAFRPFAEWFVCSADRDCIAARGVCGEWTPLNKNYADEYDSYSRGVNAAANCLRPNTSPRPEVRCLAQRCVPS